MHQLLAAAEAVICCAMFDGRNSGLFGPGEFAQMKPGALFINVARGGLVGEAALLATPHVAGLTTEMFRRTGEAFAARVLQWAAGGPPRWPANAPEFCRSQP